MYAERNIAAYGLCSDTVDRIDYFDISFEQNWKTNLSFS
jgi:hypothetical protein